MSGHNNSNGGGHGDLSDFYPSDSDDENPNTSAIEAEILTPIANLIGKINTETAKESMADAKKTVSTSKALLNAYNKEQKSPLEGKIKASKEYNELCIILRAQNYGHYFDNNSTDMYIKKESQRSTLNQAILKKATEGSALYKLLEDFIKNELSYEFSKEVGASNEITLHNNKKKNVDLSSRIGGEFPLYNNLEVINKSIHEILAINKNRENIIAGSIPTTISDRRLAELPSANMSPYTTPEELATEIDAMLSGLQKGLKDFKHAAIKYFLLRDEESLTKLYDVEDKILNSKLGDTKPKGSEETISDLITKGREGRPPRSTEAIVPYTPPLKF